MVVEGNRWGESGGYREGETVSVNRGFHRGKEIDMGYCSYYREGEQCPSLKTFSRGRKSVGEGVVVIGKGSSASHGRRSQRKEHRRFV